MGSLVANRDPDVSRGSYLVSFCSPAASLEHQTRGQKAARVFICVWCPRLRVGASASRRVHACPLQGAKPPRLRAGARSLAGAVPSGLPS